MTAPNILLIQVDQLAANALSAYGNRTVKDPHISALADAGVVFENCYCNLPMCGPSRASMHTGRLPFSIGMYDNASEFHADLPTFCHYLRGMGYRTEFSDGLVGADGGAGIRAYPDAGPEITVAVRQGRGEAFSGRELGAFGHAMGQSGGVGLVVSVPGFEPGVRQGGMFGGAFVETVDLAGFLDLWVERYRDLAPTDQALLPLTPVYLLAAN